MVIQVHAADLLVAVSALDVDLVVNLERAPSVQHRRFAVRRHCLGVFLLFCTVRLVGLFLLRDSRLVVLLLLFLLLAPDTESQLVEDAGEATLHRSCTDALPCLLGLIRVLRGATRLDGHLGTE